MDVHDGRASVFQHPAVAVVDDEVGPDRFSLAQGHVAGSVARVSAQQYLGAGQACQVLCQGERRWAEAVRELDQNPLGPPSPDLLRHPFFLQVVHWSPRGLGVRRFYPLYPLGLIPIDDAEGLCRVILRLFPKNRVAQSLCLTNILQGTGNLSDARFSASLATSMSSSETLAMRIGFPLWTLAAVPTGFP